MRHRLCYGTICLIGTLITFVNAGEPAKDTKQNGNVASLIEEAKKISRKNDPQTARAAYAKVLAAADATAGQKANAYCEIARVLSTKKQFKEALVEYDKALAIEGLSSNEKIDVLNKKANAAFRSNFSDKWASYFTDGLETALASYQAILKMPGITNKQKIDYYQKIADCQFELLKIKDANATLASACALPGLSAEEKLQARINQASGFYKQVDYARALPHLKELYAQKDVKGNDKNRIADMIQNVLYEEGRKDELMNFIKSRNLSQVAVANILFQIGDASAIAAYHAILEDNKISLNDRRQALEKLMEAYAKNRDLPGLKAAADKYIPAMIKEADSMWSIYTGAMQHWRIMNHGLRGNSDYLTWLYAHILNSPKLSTKDRIKYMNSLMNLYFKNRDLVNARKAANDLLATKDLPARDVQQAKLNLAIMDTKGTPGDIVSAVKNMVPQEGDKVKVANQQIALLASAARCAMTMRYYNVAKKLDAARQSLLATPERRSLPCTFMSDCPKDISEFLSSEYYKNPKNRGALDRKYGKRLQSLLETDAAMTGRIVTDDTGKPFKPTEFITTCDAEGVHFLFFAPYDNMKDIVDGLAQSAGYEIYFAAGAGKPYNCYMLDANTGMGDTFVTQYNNANFRNAWQQDGTAKIEHRFTKDGVASLLTLSWLAFFDNIPVDGDKYELEAIHWGHRGYTWGGSKSVHNRSSCGDLVFQNMTPENRNAIKRRIVVAAAKAYRKELSSNNGYLEIWQDPELGDREFYKTVLKPFQEKIEADLPLVKADMTAAEVDKIYRDSAKTWMNIRYVVANLRKDYLDKKRLAAK